MGWDGSRLFKRVAIAAGISAAVIVIFEPFCGTSDVLHMQVIELLECVLSLAGH